MRIAMIGSKGVPAACGGVERVVEEIGAELTARGHDVLVYGRAGYLGAPAASATAARVILTGGLAGKHSDAITHTATAAWDLLRRRVDVVHIHSPGPALLSPLPAAAGLPIVFTVHGPDWQGSKWSAPARAGLRVGLGLGMRFSSAVSAVSLALRDDLADTYHREVTYTPNGVRPVRRLPPRAIAAMGLRQDAYGLYVGRIVPGKAVDALVRAWRQAAGTVPLVVVGDGGNDGTYERKCRRLGGPSVRFIGPRHGAVLAELYSNAAAVIQPSRREGMSLVLLEAAAYGRCVVARELPSNREVLGEAMIGFAEDSKEPLGPAIMRCLANAALRRKLGQEARRRVTERFNWADSATIYERLYECAVTRRQPKSRRC